MEKEKGKLVKSLQEVKTNLEEVCNREAKARKDLLDVRSSEEEARRGHANVTRNLEEVRLNLSEVRKERNDLARSLEEVTRREEKARKSLVETHNHLEVIMKTEEETRRSLLEAKNSLKDSKRAEDSLRGEVIRLTAEKSDVVNKMAELTSQHAAGCKNCEQLGEKIKQLEAIIVEKPATRDLEKSVHHNKVNNSGKNIGRSEERSEQKRETRANLGSSDRRSLAQRASDGVVFNKENVERRNLSERELELATNKVRHL
jgi:hypothetical protein